VSAVPEDLITPRAAAKILRAHVGTIYRWILSGKLPAWRRAGARYLVSRADVEALLAPVRPAAKRPPLPSQRAQEARHRQAVESLRKAGFRI
jgi:excisionase family DNA binding protein